MGALAAQARAEEVGLQVAVARDYQPQLSTPALIAEVRRLLFAERRAGGLVCRHLADLADRIHERRDSELMAYVDELHAAACFFNLGARETRERVRVGRALRSLPQVEAAFIAGDLSYSRVREITRVACSKTESAWLERARSLDMRSLERRVASSVDNAVGIATDIAATDIAATDIAAARPPLASTDDGRRTRDTRRVTFELPAEAYALLKRALEGARHRAGAPLSNAEALEAVARDALSAQKHAPDDTTMAEPATGETATHLGSSHDHTARLLRIIGRRRHWTLDELGDRSGLSVPELQHALLLLELDCRIRRNGCLTDPL
jgi:hypothetical protein